MLTRTITLSLGLALASFCSTGQAALVITTLNLDPANALTNRLTISVAGGVATTDLSGTMEVTLDIDPITGVVNSFTLTGGPAVSPISGTDWGTPTVLGTLAGNSVGGVTGTAGPGAVTGGIAFDADDHFLTLNTGNITLDGNIVQDFVTSPFQMFGDAVVLGTLTSTPAGANTFNVSIAIPFNVNDTLAGAPINITGRLVGSGVAAVPEPAASSLIGGVAFVGLVRRSRRRMHAK